MACNNSNGNAGGFILGLLVGAALGVVGSCLANTDKGRKVRRQVMDTLDDMQDTASHKYDELRQKAKATGAQFADRVAEKAHQMHHKLNDLPATED